MLTGCAGFNAKKVGPTSIMKAREEIAETLLLDVGIQVFEPGEITKEQVQNKASNLEIRKAESHFIPYHLKNTLQQSSYWGAVRVLPVETESVDVMIRGKILESNGEHLVLQISVSDTTLNNWFSKTYESKATRAFYSGNRVGEKDAYQDLYNAISNDIVSYLRQLPAEKVKAIRTVSKLRFAEDFAPSAYDGYLAKDKKERITVNRLPAEGDPMMDRLLKIREREYMYIDTLNAYYEEYYTEMWPSYENWRKLNYEEIKAINKIKRDARMRQAGGVLLMLGAVLLNMRQIENTGALQMSMILVGSQIFVNGINISKQAEIHSAAIQELSESFGSEMRSVVMEFEGKQYELTGSAEEQFKRWRELLRQIYFEETGFEPANSMDKEDVKNPKNSE
jgi:hypothetical protein